jgi:molybdenum cofactor biosynthesis protein B
VAGIDESIEFVPVRIVIITVSDTRTEETDRSGRVLVDLAEAAGHQVREKLIVPDDVERIVEAVNGYVDDSDVDVVITTGGTGVTGRDTTPEALASIWDKEIPGFGELFRHLSFASIGASTIQSRATAGVARGTYLFALPGSTGAVKDAWEGILKTQLDVRYRPCNFVELMPRLEER